jgi:aspartate kinase
MEKIIEEIGIKTDLAKVIITSIENIHGRLATIFTYLGDTGINIFAIMGFSTSKKHADIAFMIKNTDADKVVELISAKIKEIKGSSVLIDREIAFFSLYGRKLAITSGLAGKIFASVAELGISIEDVTTCLNAFSFTVPKQNAKEVQNKLTHDFLG